MNNIEQHILGEFANQVNERIPLLGFCSPELNEINDSNCRLALPYNEQTQSLHKIMGFGALATGADAAAGLLVLYHMMKLGVDSYFCFSKAEIEFLYPAKDSVEFICNNGNIIESLLHKHQAGENITTGLIHVDAKATNSLIATFDLELTIKV